MKFIGHIDAPKYRIDELTKELIEFEDLVKFTLTKFNIDATFRLIYFNPLEWSLYQLGYEFYKVFMTSELEWFNEFILNESPKTL